MKSFFIKSKERIIWIALLLILLAIPLHFSIPQASAQMGNKNDDKYLDEFLQVFAKIRQQYVDKEKTSVSNLIYGAVEGMLNSLDDQHTSFLDKKKFASLQTDTKGSFGGLGIYIRLREDKLIIINPMEGTPAWDVGLKPGDHISEIETVSTLGITIEEAVSKLRGYKGTAVNITVLRKDEEKPLHFKIIRDTIKIKSVVYSMIDDTDFAYIKIRNFSQTTAQDLQKSLKAITKSNAEGLIIDLRYNPGGLLNSVIDAVDLFIDEGVIVYTKDRNGTINHKFTATRGTDISPYIPIIILINGYSASASEIMSGALQDHKRAILLGEKTFGKFSVQNVFDIDYNDQTAFKMTIAYYYIPSGRSLHKKGLPPDIEVKQKFYTPQEVKFIKKIKSKKLIEKYVEEYKDEKDDEKHLMPFIKSLYNNDDIQLDRETIDFLIYEKRNQDKPPKIYDVRFDDQLKEAIRLLKANKIFNIK